MTRIGTSNFLSEIAAVRYYRAQGVSADQVKAKIRKGEVSIGRPNTCEPDERVVLDAKDDRYFIEY